MAVLEQVPSLTATDAEAIETFARRVRETLGHHLVELRLYGSKVHGNATPESDIDVLVVIDDAEERWRLAKTVSDIAFDTNLACGVFVSPVLI